MCHEPRFCYSYISKKGAIFKFKFLKFKNNFKVRAMHMEKYMAEKAKKTMGKEKKKNVHCQNFNAPSTLF